MFLMLLLVMQIDYTIGNSLSMDTNPFETGDAHIYCNRNLDYIFNNPNDHCVPMSLPWDEALILNDYDSISFQLFRGSTPANDASLILNWLSMQSEDTVCVIHPSWSESLSFVEDYDGNVLYCSQQYEQETIDLIKLVEPNRTVVSTHSSRILYEILTEGIVPPTTMYRDNIHMSFGRGRYVMENLRRYAQKQPFDFWYTGEHSQYLTDKILSVVIPGDVNRDTHVNLLDVECFVDSINTDDAAADMNKDGIVDLLDVSLFVEELN